MFILLKMKVENRDIFVSSLLRVLKHKDGTMKRTEIHEILNNLKSVSEEDCVKFIFVVRAMSRRQLSFMNKDNLKTFGFNRMKTGLEMMYWLLKNMPEVFNLNINSYCSLFGTWKDIITIWEMDIRENGVKGSTINPNLVTNLLLKAVLNPNSGVEASKAIPTIRKNNELKTEHKKAINIIGKFIRSKMPKNLNTNQHTYYRAIKSSYKNNTVIYKFIKYDMRRDKGVLLEKFMNQKSFNFVRFKNSENGK